MSVHQFILPHLIGNDPITTDVSNFIDAVSVLKLYVETNDKHIRPQNMIFTWIPNVPDVNVACFSKTQLRDENDDPRNSKYDQRNHTISHALVGNDLLSLFGNQGKIRVSTLMHADIFSRISKKSEEIPSLSKEFIISKLKLENSTTKLYPQMPINTLLNLVDLAIEAIQRRRTLNIYHSGKEYNINRPSYDVITVFEAILSLFPVEIANRISFSTHRTVNRGESFPFVMLGISKGDQSLTHLVSSGEIYYDLDTDTSSTIKPSSYTSFLRTLSNDKIYDEVALCDQALMDEAVLDNEALVFDMMEKLNFISSLKFKLNIEEQVELLQKRIVEFMSKDRLSYTHQQFFIRYVQSLADDIQARYLTDKYLTFIFDISEKHPKLLNEYTLTDPLIIILIKMMDENQLSERLWIKYVLSKPILRKVLEEELIKRIKQKSLNLRYVNINESELVDYLLKLVISIRVKEISNVVLFNNLKDIYANLLERKVKLNSDLDKKFFSELHTFYQKDALTLVNDLSMLRPEWLTKYASLIFDALYQYDVTPRYLDPKERHFSDLINLFKRDRQTRLLSFYMHNVLRIYTDSRTLRDTTYDIYHLSTMIDPAIKDYYEVAYAIHELLNSHLDILFDKFMSVNHGKVEESTLLLQQAIDVFKKLIGKHTNLSHDILNKLDEKTKQINERLSTYQHWSTGIALKKMTLKALNKHIYSYDLVKEENYTHELIEERLNQPLELKRMIEIDHIMRTAFDKQRSLIKSSSWISDLFAFIVSLGLGVILYVIAKIFTFDRLNIPKELIIISYALYGLLIIPLLIYLLRFRYKHFIGRIITIIVDTFLWYIIPLGFFIASFVYFYRL